MSVMAQQNRLPLVLAGVLFLLALVSLLAVWLSSEDGPLSMRTLPTAPTPDADSPATVIKTLSAQVETVKESNTELQDQNRALTESLEGLQARLDDVFQQATSKPKADQGLMSRLQQELQRLTQRLGRLEQKPTPQPRLVNNPLATDPTSTPTLIWIEPLDADVKQPTTGLMPVSFNPLAAIGSPQAEHINGRADGATLKPGSLGASSNGKVTKANQATLPAKVEPIPVYTLPANSTLMAATAWTALLGRIPVGSRVTDPWRFKVLTGADNLAANGIRIPGLSGMIWSGVAVGDLALSCVSGELTSVTYVFQDGRINTVKNEGNEALGWIADDSGIPCVPGELKTNAPQWLAARTFLLALEAGAGAYADAETTNTVSAEGVQLSSVTGNADKFALGTALREGSGETRRWFDERSRQSFDAIFVPPGTRLSLNIDTEIPIDYDPDGRKVSYQRRLASPYRSPTLD